MVCHIRSNIYWAGFYWISLIGFKVIFSKSRTDSKDILHFTPKHIRFCQSIITSEFQSQSESQCCHVTRTWANTINAIFSSFSSGLYACYAWSSSKHHQTFRRCFWWWAREAICCSCSTDSWECASGARGSKSWWWSDSSCYRRNGRGACFSSIRRRACLRKFYLIFHYICKDEVRFMRIRTKKHEILISPGM